MDESTMAVYVSVCGRVERVEVMEMTLEGLCAAVAQRFDIGDRLRFISDEDGEPEVVHDDHLRRLAQQRQTLRVLISDSALSDLEQRMWQLRQLQWGFFQDELGRSKNQMNAVRGEIKQLRQVVEQSARREVELSNELLGERQARERLEQQAAERLEAVVQELRREQRARDTSEAALRKDLEDARQAALKYAAASDRAIQEVKVSLGEETKNRGKNIEALLSEWATSQSEIRQAIEAVRSEIETYRSESDRIAKDLVREASARQAFEQFFGEKVRTVEGSLGKIEGGTSELENRLSGLVQRTCNSLQTADKEIESRISSTVQQIYDATRAEAQQREHGDKELQDKIAEFNWRVEKVAAAKQSDKSPGRAPTSPGPQSPGSALLPVAIAHSGGSITVAAQPVATLGGSLVVSNAGSVHVPVSGGGKRSVSPSPATVARVSAPAATIAFVPATGAVRTPPTPTGTPVVTRANSKASLTAPVGAPVGTTVAMRPLR